ncbi:MAG: hypothetical protein IPK54_07995 [Dokdonella sp.]|uniref:hypothetical protein n=1 Tax=Dokdonella sp. TaxID=2291710 RepID=UPI0025C58C78|nr:hypothetical protein [Dokdonella sp.]MBK8123481.1 hypothetical protein [Dokdonella sp.]
MLAQGNPERLEHELVVDEGADRPGEPFEKRLSQTAPGIELHHSAVEGWRKRSRYVFVTAKLSRIRRVQATHWRAKQASASADSASERANWCTMQALRVLRLRGSRNWQMSILEAALA